MRIPDEQLLDEWDDAHDDACHACDSAGEVLVCIDDMCIGSGECIHGDGWALCVACQGSGDEPGRPPRDRTP